MDQLQNKTTCKKVFIKFEIFSSSFFGQNAVPAPRLHRQAAHLSSLARRRCCSATCGRWAASPLRPAARRGSGLCSECCQADPGHQQQEDRGYSKKTRSSICYKNGCEGAGGQYLDQGGEQAQEGDGHGVLASGLLNLDQQVSVVTCLHPFGAKNEMNCSRSDTEGFSGAWEW